MKGQIAMQDCANCRNYLVMVGPEEYCRLYGEPILNSTLAATGCEGYEDAGRGGLIEVLGWPKPPEAK